MVSGLAKVLKNTNMKPRDGLKNFSADVQNINL